MVSLTKSLTTRIVPIAIPIRWAIEAISSSNTKTLQGLRTTLDPSQMDAAPLGLQMFLVFESSGRERQKLGVLAKAR
jgi:hypothetical protein